MGGGNDIVFGIYRHIALSLNFIRFRVAIFYVFLGPVTSITAQYCVGKKDGPETENI